MNETEKMIEEIVRVNTDRYFKEDGKDYMVYEEQNLRALLKSLVEAVRIEENLKHELFNERSRNNEKEYEELLRQISTLVDKVPSIKLNKQFKVITGI